MTKSWRSSSVSLLYFLTIECLLLNSKGRKRQDRLSKSKYLKVVIINIIELEN